MKWIVTLQPDTAYGHNSRTSVPVIADEVKIERCGALSFYENIFFSNTEFKRQLLTSYPAHRWFLVTKWEGQSDV